MATALASALIRVPVKKGVAMTGEITLRGKVLPIGGLKEKLLAAHRAGIFTVLVPKENEKDLKGMPPLIMKKVKIHLVEHIDEVLLMALNAKNREEIFKVPKESFDKVPGADPQPAVHEDPVIRH